MTTTAQFKVGDKVRCLDGEGTDGRLKAGEIYRVSGLGIHGAYLQVKPSSNFWRLDRFELVETSSGERVVGASANSAIGILNHAAEQIADRANLRDTPEGERSMRATVEAFNALFGTAMTETQGWQFMAILKIARSARGSNHADDFVDGAAYFGLAGEAAARRVKD